MSNLDRSLDDIITSKKKTTRGRIYRGGGLPRRGSGRKVSAPYDRNVRAVPSPVLAKRAQAPASGGAPLPGGSKIIVSGFPQDVLREQILELFRETVGPVVSLILSFDDKGRSRGIAEVEFKSSETAQKAYQQFNGRLIDNS
ncbi:hypothetical protein BT69DRAFT_546089 [Atractiella rhizophila]|nr:hypothetical protein BT69DRAFT_546089 [Atractiella rhizophila]